MAILTKTIQPLATLFAYDASLAFVQMIFVSVEGTQYDIGAAEANRLCRYAASEGKIYFNNAFDGSQRVFLIYKV